MKKERNRALKDERLQTQFDEVTRARIRALAEVQETSAASIIRRAVRFYLKHTDEDGEPYGIKAMPPNAGPAEKTLRNPPLPQVARKIAEGDKS